MYSVWSESLRIWHCLADLCSELWIHSESYPAQRPTSGCTLFTLLE